MMAYKDKRGYTREHSNAVHRHRAYHHIYLKNRKKYPLPFEAYEVHHIDGDKDNNRMDNLAVLTPEEHDKAHEQMEKDRLAFQVYGLSCTDVLLEKVRKLRKFDLTPDEIDEDFIALKEKRIRELARTYPELKYKIGKGFEIEMGLIIVDLYHAIESEGEDYGEWHEEIWNELESKYEKEQNRKIRNEKIKESFKTGIGKIFGNKRNGK